MNFLRNLIILTLGIVVGFGIAKYTYLSPQLVSPVLPSPTPKPLLKYTFPSLETYLPSSSAIKITKEMFSEPEIKAYQTTFITGQKQMSMQLMVPQTATPSAGFPAILMIRGFVDPSIYQTGIGTKNAARFLAINGFVTIAPDFLGFGDSDLPPVDTFEARLERPKQLLDLLSSLESLSFINPDEVGIWGHSNGGQIAISLLEVSGKPYPTVLWAPVTKPFPYSILYYTDDSDDGGKQLRLALSNFETEYDVFDFSIQKFTSSITAPIEVHQGDADTSVPITWSDAFVSNLSDLDKDVTYFTYPGADHNLQPSWNTAVKRSLAFYKKYL